MRTAIGATAVNIAKPTNLNAPMIHAFLYNIRYITIELNGLILYDTRDNVPCNMDDWRETRARFPVGSSPQIRTQWQTLCGPKQLVTPRVLLRSAPCRPRTRAEQVVTGTDKSSLGPERAGALLLEVGICSHR